MVLDLPVTDPLLRWFAKGEPNAKCLVLSIKLKINRSRFKPLRSAGALMTSSVTAFLGPGAGCEDTYEFVPPSGIP